MKSRLLPSIAALAIFLIAAMGFIFLIVVFFDSINAFESFVNALTFLFQQLGLLLQQIFSVPTTD